MVMDFRFGLVEQKNVFNRPKNCLRDLIIMCADDPANITSPPAFVDRRRSYDGGVYIIQTSYILHFLNVVNAMAGVTYSAVVYMICLHQSFDVVAAMSKRLLYHCSIYDMSSPKFRCCSCDVEDITIPL